MNILLSLLVFCLVLFFYLHIYFHLKTSDDMEIYEIETTTKDKIEEIYDMRQPVVYSFYNEELSNICSRDKLELSYGNFDVNVRNMENNNEDEEIYVPISFDNACKLIDSKESRYLIENNKVFLDETGLTSKYKINDTFLRPYMVSSCIYDIIIGTPGTQSVFKYDVNYRNFLYIIEGTVKIKLTPPKNSKYLYEIKDYDNFEFRSPINPWNVQDEYKNDFNKVKCLDITLNKNNIIFIPAYWWYSMEFCENSTICSFKYRTYMNTISIMHRLCMSLLQSQNTKYKIIPEINYDNKDNDNKDNDNKETDK